MNGSLQQIPSELRASGLPIDASPESGLAWDKRAAIRVLESLGGTKVAVQEVAVYKVESWGPIETEESWMSSRQPGDTASDYAETSRRWAGEYIKKHDGDEATFYLLWLDDQQGAA